MRLEKFVYPILGFLQEILILRPIKTLIYFTRKNICEQGIWAEKMVMNTFGLPVVQKT